MHWVLPKHRWSSPLHSLLSVTGISEAAPPSDLSRIVRSSRFVDSFSSTETVILVGLDGLALILALLLTAV